MQILGVKIDNLSEDECLQKIETLLLDKKQHYVVTPNPEFIVYAQKDENFKDVLNRASLSVPDGQGLVFASRLYKSPLKQRVTGVDLMDKICAQAAKKKWQILLLGALPVPDLALAVADKLRQKYPGLKINYFNKTASSDPAILFVALGSPKQEKWISSNLFRFPHVGLAIGVGGAFDFMSGRISRSPLNLQKVGLEWLWRLSQEPSRLPRIYNAVIKFTFLVIKDRYFK